MNLTGEVDVKTKILRILIVEDNKQDMRKIKLGIRNRLSSFSIKIDEATSGMEAVYYVENTKTKYDILIIDYALPDMKGTFLLSKLKNLGYQKVAIGYTRFKGHYLDDMEKACAEKAFCKDKRQEFLNFLTDKANQICNL